MKVLIASDIHGHVDKFKYVYDFFFQEQCDKMIILGDIFSTFGMNVDSKELSNYLHQLVSKLITIKGNCDAKSDEDYLPTCLLDTYKMQIGSKQYVFYHGHRKVYDQDTNGYVQGHTHVANLEVINHIYYINPGSVSRPRDGKIGTFGVISEQGITIFNLNYEIVKEILF